MRKVALGGVLGGLPGMLVALVPLLLSGLDVISGDTAQIGFIGIPLLFIGVIVGMLIAASGTDYSGRVMLGALGGFVVGIAGGVALGSALSAAGSDVPALWLVIAAAAMIVGGVLGAWRGEHGHASHPTAPQH